MDQRLNLLDQLDSYKPFDDKERDSLVKIKKFVKAYRNCFKSDFTLGHITGSALVVDDHYEFTLLTYHQKINKWLQFGGHSDGYPVVSETALREAREESGLPSLEFSKLVNGIFDLDVHLIRAGNSMPDHFHFDIRFLVIGKMNEQLRVSSESKDLMWVKLEDVRKYNSQPELLRMVEKALRFE